MLAALLLANLALTSAQGVCPEIPDVVRLARWSTLNMSRLLSYGTGSDNVASVPLLVLHMYFHTS